MRRIVLLISLCLVAVSITGSESCAQPGPSLDDIKRAWQQRQDAIKSLRVTCSGVRIQPKGYFDWILPGKKSNEPNPPTDLRLPSKVIVTFDEHNCRFEIKRDSWSVKYLKVMEREEINVYKDGKNTALMTKSPIVDHPSAEISRRKKPGDIMECTYWPITSFARGLNPTFAPVNLDDYEFTGKSPVVNGKKCVELIHKTRANKASRFLLLDPQRGFLLLRYYILTEDRVTLRLDVDYAPDPALGWVPKSWDYAASDLKGVRIESNQIKQIGWEANPSLPDDTFDVQLPPGTSVYDTTGGGEVQYAIRDDGKSGPAVPVSSGATYDQLTELAQEAQKERWWSSSATIIIAGVVFVLAALALVWRWRRHRTGASPDPPPLFNPPGGAS